MSRTTEMVRTRMKCMQVVLLLIVAFVWRVTSGMVEDGVVKENLKKIREPQYCDEDDQSIAWEYDDDSQTLSLICHECEGTVNPKEFVGECSEKLRSAVHIVIGEGFDEIEDEAFRGMKNLVSVNLPSSVTTIGASAFKQCASLVTVKASSLSTIREKAFSGCVNLQSGEILDRVKTIEEEAFSYCKSLKSITIPGGVECIETSAFEGCSGLTSVTISDGVDTIASRAFASCTSLKNVSIPESVFDILEEAFSDCYGLLSIQVDKANEDFKSNDGVLFDHDEKTLLIYPAGLSGTYTIPKGVKVINDRAFSGCHGLTDVVIPSTVTSVGRYAFYDCSSLTNVKVPGTCSEIDDYAFSGCTALSDFVISDGVKRIGKGAFSGCKKVKRIIIPSNVSSLEEEAFQGCSGLESVILNGTQKIPDSCFVDCVSLQNVSIPDSVHSIGKMAFAGCKWLKSVMIPGSVKVIGESSFMNCFSLAEITLQSGLEEIEENAFYGCKSLTTISIPQNTKFIKSSAFEGCASLSNISIPSSVKIIENRAFYGCRNLRSVEVEDGVVSIKDEAFSECIRLTSVVIPSSVKSIGYCSFFHCLSLQNVTLLSNSSTVIGSDAFHGCKNLGFIELPPYLVNISSGMFCECSSLKTLMIPSSIEAIEKNAFSGCTNLTSIIIPSNVATIEEGAFSNCIQLTNVTLLEGVQTIGDYVFSGCINMTEVHIPSSVNEIGGHAFSGMINLRDIKVDEFNQHFVSDDGVLYTHIDGMVDMLVKYPQGRKTTNCVISQNVISIGDNAFDGCDDLITVNVPSSVIFMGNRSFSGLNKLESINVDPDNTVYMSDNGVLYDSVYGILIRFPKGKKGDYSILNHTTCICDGAFEGCEGLTSVIFPDDVMSIGNGSFSGCVNLKSIIIPNGVRVIQSYAFHGCSQLQSVIIPDGVISIQDEAFSGCISLKALAIPSTVDVIGSSAFKGCILLENVAFYEVSSVKDIFDEAFYGCINLRTITLPSTVEFIDDCAFCNTGLTTIMIPVNTSVIGLSPFRGCSDLVSIGVDSHNMYYESLDGVLFDKITVELIQFPNGKNGSYIIPNITTRLAENAFCDSKLLTSVTITSYLMDYDPGTFLGCTSLNSLDVEYPDGELKSINGVLFSKDDTLLKYPEGRNGIYHVPFGTKEIGDSAFRRCSGLTAVSIPSTVSNIGDHAFEGCYGLQELTIEAGVETIGKHSFSGCTGLTSLVIPDVKKLNPYAFSGCINLRNVTYLGVSDPCSLNSEVFEGCDMIHHICVPLEYYDALGIICDRNNYCTGCETLHFGHENCLESRCFEGKMISGKNKNATDWENRTNACVEFKCDEQAGFIMESVCKKSEGNVCSNDGCLISSSFSGPFVEINVKGLTMDILTPEEIASSISEMSGANINSVLLELGDQGTVLRVVVPINDEEEGEMISKAVNKLRQKCKNT